MSERLKDTNKNQEQLRPQDKERQEALSQAIEKRAEQAKHEYAETIENIRHTVESEAETKQEKAKKSQEKEPHDPEMPTFVNRELKDLAYQRTLKRTQNKLPLPSRLMSKVIHQPAVEAISEVASKTVARPSGTLMGGIVAFLGNGTFLWAAKHYGYEYNFLLLALLFVGGFFIGLLVELGLYLANRKTK